MATFPPLSLLQSEGEHIKIRETNIIKNPTMVRKMIILVAKADTKS